MADSRKLTVFILGDSRSLEKAFLRGGKAATTFNARISRGFGGITRGLGLTTLGVTGLTAGLTKAVGSAARFEESMQKVAGLSGVAQAKIAGLSKEVLTLAPQVGRGPQELADALFFITSSGIDASKALGVLTASAKASVAGLGETKVVADAVTSAMNAYGPTVVDAKKATDVLVATVREGKGEASDFAGVIGNVAAIAAQLSVSFNDVGAALAAQTRLGTDAETAAIQLQQVFSSLVKVSPQAEKAFRSVGLSTAGLRAELQGKGLLATLETIRTAFGNNLPAMAKAFGDIRALRGVLSLVGKQAEATTGIFDRMKDSSNALAIAFAAVSGDSAQKFRRLQAAVDVTRITIGAALAPAAEKAASAITEWLSVSGNQERVQRQVTEAVRSFAAVVRGLRDIIVPVVDALGGFENTAKLLLSVLVATKVLAFARAIKTLRLAMLRLGALGVITLGVEILLNKGAIDAKVQEFLRGSQDSLRGPPLGFLATKQVKIPVGIDADALEKTRDKMAGLVGENDLFVKGLDAAIKKMRELDEGAQKVRDKVVASFAKEQKTFGITKLVRPKPASPKLSVVPDGISASQRNRFFDNALTRSLDRVQDSDLKGQLEKLGAIGATITKRLALTKDITRRMNLEDKLLDIQRQAKGIREQFFDNALTRSLDRAGDGSQQQQLSKLAAVAAMLTKRIEVTKDITRKLNLEDQLVSVGRQQAAVRDEIGRNLSEAREEKNRNLLDALQLGVDKSQITKPLGDDIAALNALRSGIQKQIAAGGDVVALQGRLLTVTQAIASAREEIATNARAALQGRQFVALGLNAEGGDRVPGVENLRKQLSSLTERLGAAPTNVSSKLQARLAGVRKVLSGELGKATVETRERIRDLFATIRGEFDKGAKGPLTKTSSLNTTKLLDGLGLSRDLEKQLRSRLSSFNSAGSTLAGSRGGQFGQAPIVVESHTTIQMDGDVVSRSVTRSQQKRKRRNPTQKRGPNRGI